MSPKKSGGAAHATAASKMAFGVDHGRDSVGGDGADLAPAKNLNDSLVRRAMTEIPSSSSAPPQDVFLVENEQDGNDATTPPTGVPLRRAMTELPPIVSEDPVLEHRLSKSIRPVSVRFTTELADKNGLTRWKTAAIALTGAHKLKVGVSKAAANQPRRTDSRIAGTIERQQELERAHLDDSLKGYDEGVQLLEKRLQVMGLKTEQMGDDGNCQFRALSFNLFGSQEHHQLVRETCVAHIMSKEDDYSIFFDPGSGEFEMYCRVRCRSRSLLASLSFVIFLVFSTRYVNKMYESRTLTPGDGHEPHVGRRVDVARVCRLVPGAHPRGTVHRGQLVSGV